MLTKQTIRQQGFTLVELSIVIIIIGFLIAGIAAGQSLMKQARLNAVIQEMTTHSLEVHTFFTRYSYLPGDFPNASSYFNSANCPAGLSVTNGVAGGSASGCDGNGDGQIAWGSLVSEGSRAWQHLNLAGIMPGNFTGVCTVSPQGAQVGINVPGTQYNPNGGYFLDYGVPYGNQELANNYLNLGAQSTGYASNGALFLPADAASIDIKIDDGLPMTGNLIGGDGQGGSNCTTGSNAYNLSNPDYPCQFAYALEDFN